MNLHKWYEENGYTKTSEGIQQLKDQLGINVKEYDGEIFVLAYNQIDSPKMHPVVMECRGIILDNDLNVLCRPFDRFFNYGEALEITQDFDLELADIYEKVDGSLVKLWNYKGEWYVGTRGTAFAESENYTGEIFENLIVEAFGCSSREELSDKMNLNASADYTFIFEYTSPKNRVVTPYTEDKMVLLGVRHNENGYYEHHLELNADIMVKLGLNVRAVDRFSFSSVDDMKMFLSQLDTLDEGFVCHDLVNDIRVKMKSPKYVAIHRIKGDTLPTPKKIMELAVTNEDDEFLAYFPEFREQFEPIRAAFNDMVLEMEFYYDHIQGIETQKDFALEAIKRPYSGLLFAARKNDTRPTKEFNLMDTSKRVKILGSYISEGE